MGGFTLILNKVPFFLTPMFSFYRGKAFEGTSRFSALPSSLNHLVDSVYTRIRTSQFSRLYRFSLLVSLLFSLLVHLLQEKDQGVNIFVFLAE